MLVSELTVDKALPLTKTSVLSSWATIITFSKLLLPTPLTKIYSVPIFSIPTSWSMPKSLPFLTVWSLDPAMEPEFTTTGLSDEIKVPIKPPPLAVLNGCIPWGSSEFPSAALTATMYDWPLFKLITISL